MNEKELQEAFLLFLAQKSGAKNEKELQQYVKNLGEDGLKKAYSEFQEALQAKTKKAKHGAKLLYFKSLKHQCADDEELVYFKKGGSIGCGCKKKEQGGEITKAQKGNVIDKFKNRKQVNPEDTVHVNGKAYSLTDSEGKRVDNRFPTYSNKQYLKDLKSNKKDERNRAIKQDLKTSKDGGKFCKKHLLGGSLNGIPFYQAGTNQGGINPYDSRYSLAERLRASTNSGNNKIYNFFKNIFTSRPAPKYNSRMKNATKSGTSQQTKITPANALLTDTLVRNDLLKMSDEFAIKPFSKREKLVTKDISKPKLIKSKSQTNFGGVQRGWRNKGQFESVIKNLTPLLLMWLDLQGISTENALTLQQGINRYLKSRGDYRRISEDNRWGNLSLSALNEILQNVPNNVSLLNLPEENPTELYPTRREGLEAGLFRKGGLIYFYQAGTNEGGLPTAPKAEDRYKNSRRDSVAYWTLTPDELGRSIKRVTTPNKAKIQREVVFTRGAQNNDTIYTEIPEHNEWRLFPIIKTYIKPRKGFSFAPTPEYETLKRRFNTAWNLAK